MLDLKVFDEADLNTRIEMTKDMIIDSGINGCIAGSSMLYADFSLWESAPDIDVFVYNEISYGYAMAYIEANGFTPGGKGKKNEAEEVRRSWTLNSGFSSKYPVNTIQYHRDNVAVNITHKRDADNILDTLCSFDMSIIMVGIDISTKATLDLRGENHYLATPNQFKQQLYNHPSRFTVARALRQWDRVIKYANRGYDTRPMAEFYLKLINEVLDTGALFGTDKDIESFAELEPGFIEMKNIISVWLEEHND